MKELGTDGLDKGNSTNMHPKYKIRNQAQWAFIGKKSPVDHLRKLMKHARIYEQIVLWTRVNQYFNALLRIVYSIKNFILRCLNCLS